LCAAVRKGLAWIVVTPKALDSIVDVVLAYRPKARSQPAIQRKRRATKIEKAK
jgi:hypothetical protein